MIADGVQFGLPRLEAGMSAKEMMSTQRQFYNQQREALTFGGVGAPLQQRVSGADESGTTAEGPPATITQQPADVRPASIADESGATAASGAGPGAPMATTGPSVQPPTAQQPGIILQQQPGFFMGTSTPVMPGFNRQMRPPGMLGAPPFGNQPGMLGATASMPGCRPTGGPAGDVAPPSAGSGRPAVDGAVPPVESGGHAVAAPPGVAATAPGGGPGAPAPPPLVGHVNYGRGSRGCTAIGGASATMGAPMMAGAAALFPGANAAPPAAPAPQQASGGAPSFGGPAVVGVLRGAAAAPGAAPLLVPSGRIGTGPRLGLVSAPTEAGPHVVAQPVAGGQGAAAEERAAADEGDGEQARGRGASVGGAANVGAEEEGTVVDGSGQPPQEAALQVAPGALGGILKAPGPGGQFRPMQLGGGFQFGGAQAQMSAPGGFGGRGAPQYPAGFAQPGGMPNGMQQPQPVPNGMQQPQPGQGAAMQQRPAMMGQQQQQQVPGAGAAGPHVAVAGAAPSLSTRPGGMMQPMPQPGVGMANGGQGLLGMNRGPNPLQAGGAANGGASGGPPPGVTAAPQPPAGSPTGSALGARLNFGGGAGGPGGPSPTAVGGLQVGGVPGVGFGAAAAARLSPTAGLGAAAAANGVTVPNFGMPAPGQQPSGLVAGPNFTSTGVGAMGGGALGAAAQSKTKRSYIIIIGDEFEPDFTLNDELKPPKCQLTCSEAQVGFLRFECRAVSEQRKMDQTQLEDALSVFPAQMVSLLDAVTQQPIQPDMPLPLRFPNCHLNDVYYEDGIDKAVEELAILKAPLGRYEVMPSLRIQSAGTSGRVGFVDRGEAEPGSTEKPPKIGDGIFDYTLHFEADAVVEMDEEEEEQAKEIGAENLTVTKAKELYLDCKAYLKGTLRCTREPVTVSRAPVAA